MRVQRAAWHPYFMDVKAIIFLAPISVFDERIEGEGGLNRLEDSIKFWTTICKSKLLAKVVVVLSSLAPTYLSRAGRTHPLPQQVRHPSEEARTRRVVEGVYPNIRRPRK